MLILDDGTKIKAGMAFETKTGVVPFVVLTVHHDGTVTFAGEKNVFKRPYYNTWAARGETMRVPFAKFKEIFKRRIESEHEREARKVLEEQAKADRVRAKEADHEEALRLDLLVRAAHGENFGDLLEEFNRMIQEAKEEGGLLYGYAGG